MPWPLDPTTSLSRLRAPLLALLAALSFESIGGLSPARAAEPAVGQADVAQTEAVQAEAAAAQPLDVGQAQAIPIDPVETETQLADPQEADSPETKAAEAETPETPASPWAATLELYGFLPWVDTTTTVRGFEATTELDPGQVINNLQGVFAARGSVEHHRLGVLTDIFYSQLGAADSRTASGSQGTSFTGSSRVTAITGIYDLALRYRFGEREAAIGKPGQYSLIPYAGLRIINAQLGVAAQLRNNDTGGTPVTQGQGSLDRTWAQPLIGTQASLFLSPRLRVFARGDVGGFGLSGARDLSGNAQLGLGYALGKNTDLNVSWRYLGLAYDNGSNPETAFSSDWNGVEIGLKLFL